MNYLNITLSILAGYVLLVLLAEMLIWRIQPTMKDGVTITVRSNGDTPIQSTSEEEEEEEEDA